MLDFIKDNKIILAIVIVLIILIVGIVKLVNKNNTQEVDVEDNLMDSYMSDEQFRNEELDETQNMIYDDIVYGEEI